MPRPHAGGGPNASGTTGFRGVPEEVWNFRIGGYQVCQKWLKDRKGRTLSEDDIVHYQKIVVALMETIRLMGEIDQAIDAHGGWPLSLPRPPEHAPNPRRIAPCVWLAPRVEMSVSRPATIRRSSFHCAVVVDVLDGARTGAEQPAQGVFGDALSQVFRVESERVGQRLQFRRDDHLLAVFSTTSCARPCCTGMLMSSPPARGRCTYRRISPDSLEARVRTAAHAYGCVSRTG